MTGWGVGLMVATMMRAVCRTMPLHQPVATQLHGVYTLPGRSGLGPRDSFGEPWGGCSCGRIIVVSACAPLNCDTYRA
ncbi:hypothetical protein KCP74_25235 [Salmonella enterica subsp. enterica]|nr:hypothetical protein KCP74_25235 [Salmonella enterica subsp. enterica]